MNDLVQLGCANDTASLVTNYPFLKERHEKTQWIFQLKEKRIKAAKRAKVGASSSGELTKSSTVEVEIEEDDDYDD